MQSPSLLIVEDNPYDVELLRRGFKMISSSVRLHVVGDGSSALRFLRQTGEFDEAPIPKLILLDMILPDMDGWGVLAELEQDATLMSIPVIIWSGATVTPPVEESRHQGILTTMRKPSAADGFVESARSIEAMLQAV